MIVKIDNQAVKFKESIVEICFLLKISFTFASETDTGNIFRY